ncbi:type VI secretion system baseplate subunit TssK [Vibrio gazogenes]|uniref:Type VI secretion, VC_A0110, EvfL, ImpJ, VasE n=1 Tax=Vibrio gazogenes DSM 21264 = NBRC 103151 TaxID=1123492 RepID=A0A1M4TG06_VIBGA|nr:type VI secretion system baseplate subunit TssK [Vibrio gazogenes]USP16085.1 type VI secretion system baseplate subunit TssK [Vibrio gazogenes]SHE43325.1 Type VI secretion, VC_A0110, EvfL, ImpJ, VasE [Vibrio gazogenes DSM 21264] [Vibrio gazogenes DSM 21264 = NBRC 103151]SJN54237.1 hypothetical protein BQ6471_00898 [Vibrio gazogenes]
MTTLSTLPQPVCWFEGMMLSPQHFQQNHIYWERQLEFLTQSLQPYQWGILSMRVDESRLLEGVVEVTALRAIMPDGLLVDYDGLTTEPAALRLALDLNDYPELAEVGKAKIMLTVPIRVPGSASHSSDIQRFVATQSEPVKDDNTGEGSAEVQRLQPCMALQIGSKVRQQYVSLPLLEVRKTEGDQFEVTEYSPPLLQIGADHFLHQQEQGLERRPLQNRLQKGAFLIRKKARQLAGFAEKGDEQFGNRVTEQHRHWIRAMVQHLPEFELLADNEKSAPWSVYQVLARVVGTLCELDMSAIPPKLPRYSHDDCQSGIDVALNYIISQLDKVNLRYTSLPFEEGQDGVFSIAFDKAWSGQDLLIELQARDNQIPAEMAEWLADCRIASARIHKELSIKRVLGAKSEATEFDEATGIRQSSGNALFYIKVDERFIKAGQSLVIACTNGKIKSMQPKRIILHLPHQTNIALDEGD